MATPIAHALVGVSLLCLASSWRRKAGVPVSLSSVTAAALLACAPDLDLLVGYLWSGDSLQFHFGISHSLGFALCMSLLLSLLPRPNQPLELGLLILLLLGSHGLVDLLTGPQWGWSASYGLAWLWPVWSERIQSPITLFRGVQHAQWFSAHNMLTLSSEVLIWGTLTSLVLWRTPKQWTWGRLLHSKR